MSTKKKNATAKVEVKADVTPVVEVKVEAPVVPATNPGIEEPVTTVENNYNVVVIPFRDNAEHAQAEIAYALKSFLQNLDDVKLVVVGDLPTTTEVKFEHIPHVAEIESFELDLVHQLLAVIASDLVPEIFILSAQNMSVINPITAADIFVFKANGMLGDVKTFAPDAEALANTIKVLQDAFLPTFDYETNTPVILHKDHLAKVIDSYNAAEKPYLIISLYMNLMCKKFVPIILDNVVTDPISAGISHSSPDVAIMKRVINNRKFLYHKPAGFAGALPHLKKLFDAEEQAEVEAGTEA
ncbi:MAG: hypothetical protein H7296_07440 [Bacteroidia bacterium]|nr:hypothetical protein [Bacteroidia bacterium]